jgi:hypothetical protein
VYIKSLINPATSAKFCCVAEHTADLLVEIAKRPLIASYIKNLSYGEPAIVEESRRARDRALIQLTQNKILEHFKKKAKVWSDPCVSTWRTAIC